MSRLTSNDARGLVEAYQAVYAPQELTEEQVWEEVETWVNSLLEEGYDLSDYTWEEMYEEYLSEMGQTRTTGQNSGVFTLKTTPGAGSASSQGGGRGSGSRPTSGSSPAAKPSPTSGNYQSRFAGARDAAVAKAQTIKGSPVVGPGKVGTGAPAPTPAARPSGGTPSPAASARPAARPAAAAPATQTGSTGKPLVGGIERRTPTRAEMDAAKAYRTPAATTGALGAANAAAAAKPVPFGSSTPAPAPKPAAAPTPTPAAAPAPKPSPSATGSKKPGSVFSHFDPFDVIKGHLLDEGYADTEESALAIMANMSEEWRVSILNEGDNYDKNRKRAAQRAAERNAARDRGQTGNVPGVGYVTSRRERETYTDAAGTERHKTGARMPSKDKKDN